jgi:hypothetical protein
LLPLRAKRGDFGVGAATCRPRLSDPCSRGGAEKSFLTTKNTKITKKIAVILREVAESMRRWREADCFPYGQSVAILA